jgi:hypothetical protein
VPHLPQNSESKILTQWSGLNTPPEETHWTRAKTDSPAQAFQMINFLALLF